MVTDVNYDVMKIQEGFWRHNWTVPFRDSARLRHQTKFDKMAPYFLKGTNILQNKF